MGILDGVALQMLDTNDYDDSDDGDNDGYNGGIDGEAVAREDNDSNDNSKP